MLKGMRKYEFGAAAATALFVIPISAFSQSIEVGPGGVRVYDGQGGGQCEQLRRACENKDMLGERGEGKLPQIPGDLPTTSSERCVRRIVISLSQQGPIGRTRRRKLPQVSRDLQRALVKSAECQCCRVAASPAPPRAPVIPKAASVGGLRSYRAKLAMSSVGTFRT